MKNALVLGGGGSRGAYQIGVWQGLLEMEIPIDIVTGTSVGAINGCMVAQNKFDAALSLWKEIETNKVFDLNVDDTLPQKKKIMQTAQRFLVDYFRRGGSDNQPLRRLLWQHIDESAVRRSSVEYGLVTVNLGQRRPVEYFKEQIPAGELIDYVLASSAVYPAVKPQKIEGEAHIDGGYYDNLPVQMALERGAECIIAVELEAPGVVHKEPLKQAEHLRHIRCYWDLGPMLVFDKHTAAHNIRLGYLDCMRSYGAFDGCAFAFMKGAAKQQMQEQPAFQQELDRLLRLYDASAPVDKLVLENLRRHLEKKYRRPAQDEGSFLLGAMETAGELFGLSNETIYSAQRFRRRVAEKIETLSLPPTVFAAKEEQNVVKTLKNSATFFQKEVRAMYLAKLILETLQTHKNAAFLPLTSVMMDEFLAAYYIVSAGLYNGSAPVAV
ncbi:MAG: patatin-like phospholipase family protein [Clostridia bacterium]|nr:patatin-like phospholipase family protein [Clostridia bacterium]